MERSWGEVEEGGEGSGGDTIIQLLMERRIWSGIIKTNGCVCVCVLCVCTLCFHVCMFTCLQERKKEREAMRGKGARGERGRG